MWRNGTRRRRRPEARSPDPGRRGVLKLLGRTAAALGAAGLAPLLGCRSREEQRTPAAAPGPTRIPLAELPEGARVQVTHRGRPVEVRRTAEGVVARSLVCTHFGCVVRYDATQEAYLCPCHDGVYDARGQVLGGPPTRPLPTYEARIRGDAVVLGDLET